MSTSVPRRMVEVAAAAAASATKGVSWDPMWSPTWNTSKPARLGLLRRAAVDLRPDRWWSIGSRSESPHGDDISPASRRAGRQSRKQRPGPRPSSSAGARRRHLPSTPACRSLQQLHPDEHAERDLGHAPRARRTEARVQPGLGEVGQAGLDRHVAAAAAASALFQLQARIAASAPWGGPRRSFAEGRSAPRGPTPTRRARSGGWHVRPPSGRAGARRTRPCRRSDGRRTPSSPRAARRARRWSDRNARAPPAGPTRPRSTSAG